MIILLPFLLCSFKTMYAQFNFENKNKKEKYKINRVRFLKTYAFQNESDSSLVRLNTYDTFGNPLTSKTFAPNGKLTGLDTFIYDINHYLIKTLNSDGGSRSATSVITNDITGKEMKIDIFMNDSLSFHSGNNYDNNNRVIKSMIWNNMGDTTVTNSYYDIKGIKTKIVIFDKKPDSTIIIPEYNSLGNLLHWYRNDFESKSSSEYAYDSNGNNNEIVTVFILRKKKTVTTKKFSYHTNGLAYEFLLFTNNKQTDRQKVYYTYY